MWVSRPIPGPTENPHYTPSKPYRGGWLDALLGHYRRLVPQLKVSRVVESTESTSPPQTERLAIYTERIPPPPGDVVALESEHVYVKCSPGDV